MRSALSILFGLGAAGVAVWAWVSYKRPGTDTVEIEPINRANLKPIPGEVQRVPVIMTAGPVATLIAVNPTESKL